MLARRDDLVILLRASRELPPDTDRYLAERFLDHVDRRASLPSPQASSLPWLRDPNKVAAALLAIALALTVAAPLSVHAILGRDRDMPPAWFMCSTHAGSVAPQGSWRRIDPDARGAEGYWRRENCP